MGIPKSDYYSQVKGLEGKSEAERRRLVYKALVRRGDAAWIIPLVVSVLVTAAWIAGGFELARIASIATGAPTTSVAASGAAPAANAPSGVILVTTPPAPPPPPFLRPMRTTVVGMGVVVFLAAFLLTRRVLVVRTLKRLINKVVCPFCEFSLIGLRPTGSFVTCPECGERLDLFQYGLKPDDLLSGDDKLKPLPGAGRFGAYRTPPTANKPQATGGGRRGRAGRPRR